MASFSYHKAQEPDTGWETIELIYEADTSEERTTATFTPTVGCNLISFTVGGVEYMVDRGETPQGMMILGSPVLYPMPNRVANAQFTFDGHTFAFEPNNGTNFIHGLVQRVPWECEEPVISDESISVQGQIRFSPGNALYELFPIANTLQLTFTLKPGMIRYDFVVTNDDASKRLPWGLAIHPYFRIHGPRSSVRLQVPAQKWMEAEELLPTGRLVEMGAQRADIRQPTSLEGLDLDDVFWGLSQSRPSTAYYDDLGTKLTLTASDLYTHAVVYTPQGRPFFCIENQSCSTDAHNLYARGLVEESHLMILDPGEENRSWIAFRVSAQ